MMTILHAQPVLSPPGRFPRLTEEYALDGIAQEPSNTNVQVAGLLNMTRQGAQNLLLWQRHRGLPEITSKRRFRRIHVIQPCRCAARSSCFRQF